MAYWTTGDGLIGLQILGSDARSCSHSGPCDDDIMALSKKPYIAKQLAAINPTKLRAGLRAYGAWDETQLADRDQNMQRILWIACADVSEQS